MDSLDKVYLTENGQSVYAIMSIKAIKEMEETIANMAITADFMMGHVAYDTVVWNEDLDIAPETLYASCISAV